MTRTKKSCRAIGDRKLGPYLMEKLLDDIQRTIKEKS